MWRHRKEREPRMDYLDLIAVNEEPSIYAISHEPIDLWEENDEHAV